VLAKIKENMYKGDGLKSEVMLSVQMESMLASKQTSQAIRSSVSILPSNHLGIKKSIRGGAGSVYSKAGQNPNQSVNIDSLARRGMSMSIPGDNEK